MKSKVGLATLYGAGLTGIGPGTAGSAVAAILAYPILLLPSGGLWLAAGTILFTILGTRVASLYMRDHDVGHDPSEVVIDELAGQWLTYLIGYGWFYGIAGSYEAAIQLLGHVAASPLYLALGFVLFRVFDILKPWPISVADEKIKGGWGVMFDDLVAAIPAGTILCLLYLFLPILSRQLESVQ